MRSVTTWVGAVANELDDVGILPEQACNVMPECFAPPLPVKLLLHEYAVAPRDEVVPEAFTVPARKQLGHHR